MRIAPQLVFSIGIAALALVACAGTTGTTGTPAAKAEVSMKGFAFSPAALTVAKGTAVTFSNADSAAHTVTSGANGTKDGKFDKEIAGGASTTITFDTAGVFDYFCALHSSMKAKITVQ